MSAKSLNKTDKKQELRRLLANLFVAIAFPTMVLGLGVLFTSATGCCNEHAYSFERFNFLRGILPRHDIQLSFSIIMFGIFMLSYFVSFGLASLIRGNKRYFLNVLVTAVQLLPLFAIFHLNYWFTIQGRSVVWVQSLLVVLVLPAVWLTTLWLVRKLQLRLDKQALIGLHIGVLGYIYLVFLSGSFVFLGALLIFPSVAIALIVAILSSRKLFLNS